MSRISAAKPTDLAVYARAGESVVPRLTAEARGLEATLGPFGARCTEYRVSATSGLAERTSSYARHEGELAAWVNKIAQGFLRADLGVQFGPPVPLLLRQQPAVKDEQARWNRDARALIMIARLIRPLVAVPGNVMLLTNPVPASILAAITLLYGADMVKLITQGDAARRSQLSGLESAKALDLLLQGFWYESMNHVDPQLFRELAVEIDALNLVTHQATSNGTPRDEHQFEHMIDPRTGALNVTVEQAFPSSVMCTDGSTAPFAPLVADSMSGDHAGISYFPDEQVRLERLNAATGDYRINIAGLDPNKPAAANNFEAVALTSQGVTDGNPYYEQVKERFLADLGRIPEGSTLHMEGHSMGGGMCFLLRDDPEVQQALVSAGVTVGSMITFGAVRPKGEAGEPQDDPDSPFAGAEERHYVNADDSLALNVGAGHADDPTVIMLDNGKVEEPTAAHTGYGDTTKYDKLPPELQRMPFTVDPQTYTVLSPKLPEVPIPVPDSPSILGATQPMDVTMPLPSMTLEPPTVMPASPPPTTPVAPAPPLVMPILGATQPFDSTMPLPSMTTPLVTPVPPPPPATPVLPSTPTPVPGPTPVPSPAPVPTPPVPTPTPHVPTPAPVPTPTPTPTPTAQG